MLQALLGNATAEKVLLYIANYGDGYANGIARTFKLSASQVYKQLTRLEAGGLLASRDVGRTRVFTFNPRWAFLKPLKEILNKALKSLSPEEIRKYYRERRRPQRTRKAL